MSLLPCNKIFIGFGGVSPFSGWWKATRAFGILGVLVLVGSTVLVVLCIFVFTKEKMKMVYIVNVIVTFVGGK